MTVTLFPVYASSRPRSRAGGNNGSSCQRNDGTSAFDPRSPR